MNKEKFFTFQILGAAWCVLITLHLLPQVSKAQDVSVAISDNVIVLNSRERSGVLELVNFASTPAEYKVKVLSLPEEVEAGGQFVRWAPRRAVVPANRTIPLRVAARPRGSMSPGEYVVRIGVQARGAALPDTDFAGEDDEQTQGLGVSVPIQPILPATVYYRHEIDAPQVEIVGYSTDIEGPFEAVGGFLTAKDHQDRSFVGAAVVTHEPSGAVVLDGRVHVPPGQEPGPLLIPASEDIPEMSGDDEYCLQLWAEFPPQGEPYTEFCN
ncbi:hypothetical protein [Spiribacter roseus]|uniref:hypothetical protein n=1 Tax=Spiribacter roseus TaxID=1855875 RepID=UPI001330358E|nr:hypothetical protein [Spiribacter roseus]